MSIWISLRIITYASYSCSLSFATLPQPLDAPVLKVPKLALVLKQMAKGFRMSGDNWCWFNYR
ncbi:MAG: hypothetical protein WBM44_09015 [Waterburya sp.]